MAGHGLPGYGELEDGRLPMDDIRRRNFEMFVQNATVRQQIANVINTGPSWEALQYLGVGGSGSAAMFGRFDAAGVLQDVCMPLASMPTC